MRRSSSEFRKLCDGFEAGEKSGYAAKDTKKEHSAIKHTFASIFEKIRPIMIEALRLDQNIPKNTRKYNQHQLN